MQHETMTIKTFINRFVEDRDRAELELSDVLDIKASIVLVVITFLSALVERLNLSGLATILSVFTVLSLAASCALTLLALWPREYDFESKPSVIRDRMEEMYNSFIEYPQVGETAEMSTLNHANEKHIKAVEQRLERNYAHNRAKAKFTCHAFYVLLPAIIIEMVVLLARSFLAMCVIKIPF